MCGCIKGTDRLQQLYFPHCKNKIVKISLFTFWSRRSQQRKKSTLPKVCRSKKTAEATGFSERTVNCVLLEKRKLDGSSFTSPNKRYKESRVRLDVVAFDTDAICRTVHEL